MTALAIVDGRVFTSSAERPWAEAVAIDGGRIVAVGSTEEVLRAVPGAEVIDASKGTVVPGFIDAHNHFLATGESLDCLDVRWPAVRSVPDLVDAIREAVRKQAPGTPVRAYGYDDAKYDRAPTRWDLDAVAPSNPVTVGHVSGHYVLLNSLALGESGVDEAVADPPGGRIDRDERGRATGVFRDAAMGLVRPTVVDVGHHGPNFHVVATEGELVRAVEVAGRAYLAAGLTTVCDAQVTRRELAAYQAARGAGVLLVRTVCMPLSNQQEAYESLGLAGPFGDEWLSIGAMKFYCDGSLIGGTAVFSEPYGVAGEFGGSLFWEPEELVKAITRAHRAGWQVGVHAQGDRAIGIVLDAFESALSASPRPDARFRIEHAGYPTPDQLSRMARLGVTMVCQPSYLVDSGEQFLARLGTRAHRLEPLREALDLGVAVVISSDSDVASYRPLDTIAAATQRVTASGRPIGPDQALTLTEALRAHTIDAARVLYVDGSRGSIEVGKLADIAILDADLFDVDVDGVRDVGVRATLVAGEVVNDAL